MLRAIDFHGLKGVEFSKGEYTALLIPEMGANLVRLANTRLGAEILRTGVRTCYEVDEQTTYWTLWNNGGQVPYCCPEPQTWTTNAPNAADPAAEGFRAIDPGESWRTTFRLYAK